MTLTKKAVRIFFFTCFFVLSYPVSVCDFAFYMTTNLKIHLDAFLVVIIKFLLVGIPQINPLQRGGTLASIYDNPRIMD